jgi:DNA-3-methyladenine glycosylase II
MDPFAQVLSKASSVPKTKGGWYLKEGIEHLVRVEPRLKSLFISYELPSVYLSDLESAIENEITNFNDWNAPPFTMLLQIIVYQQLSGASAKAVWNKFLGCLQLTGDQLTPEIVKSATFAEHFDSQGKKKILVNGNISGLSSSKVKYILCLCDAFMDENSLKSLDWINVSDEQLYEKLITIKGFGPWSVHMFMMFALHRPNVLPLGDLGIRRGLCKFFGYPPGHLENKKNLHLVEELNEKWSPYASLASFYLWKHSEERSASNTTEETEIMVISSKEIPAKRKNTRKRKHN